MTTPTSDSAAPDTATLDTVIFDLDGTLVDSAPDMHAAANRALARDGRAPISLASSSATGYPASLSGPSKRAVRR